jgi:uncharacterized zinc-type alcohol dehydrogenase-like protein
MKAIKGYAAKDQKSQLTEFEYVPDSLGPEQVDIDVEYCGICHSDLSMINNDWDMTEYPFIPGHEIVGKVSAIGDKVTKVKVGQTVGLGWCSSSCMTCKPCLRGDHNMCVQGQQTIVGRHGGFAQRVRGHQGWTIALPDGLDATSAGPLFCGGITVFNPLIQFDIKPTDRVGVVGIGGLGHMALQFLNKWGCHVTAFTSSESKTDEAKELGAHKVVASDSDEALDEVEGQYDFILVTANASLNWEKLIAALGPRGRIHFVGAVMEPVPVEVFSLLMGQKEMSASPLGSPYNTIQMLDFCARHNIEPKIETFPMSKVNEAIDHLKDGNARYRIVLKADF